MTSDSLAPLPQSAHVTLVVPDPDIRDRLVRVLQSANVQIKVIPARPDLAEMLSLPKTDLVVVPEQCLGEETHAFLRGFKQHHGGSDVIVLTDSEDAARLLELAQSGAFRSVSRRSNTKELDAAVGEYVRSLRAAREGNPDLGPPPRLSDFVSRSPRMSELVAHVRRIVAVRSSVLITGETGVGKERLARAIHAERPDPKSPFVPLNCAAIPESLIESELFGHVAGAFTGAGADRKGRFELANGGTLFLDEIGDLPTPLQVKLLDVLESRTFYPIGAETTRSVDFRLIAATNRDLRADVVKGRFREDLLFRLDVVHLHLPPLRERREDLPHLIGQLMRHFRIALPRPEVKGVAEDALDALLAWDWPGNVRELRNAIERAMLLADSPRIRLADLPEPIRGRSDVPRNGDAANLVPRLPESFLDLPLRKVRQRAVAEAERAYISGLLERTNGHVEKTARLAGISSRALYEKMRHLDLDKMDFR